MKTLKNLSEIDKEEIKKLQGESKSLAAHKSSMFHRIFLKFSKIRKEDSIEEIYSNILSKINNKKEDIVK